ncbi:WD repeat-containing protein 87-like isoform X3 [Micropterus salmoides]|uniref:WD repeat-containing protein 87-like isoform X3 n=1 Tax=Micropterus salmoides TaxID=27706 RepID=UPI0018EA9F9C|nr:WD repeat-containing protein 87-like isoform X3 [Micropterus salmoides]
MSSVECLREFVNERLTAAAEEIFGVFIKTVVEYEEEIDRQRRLLDIVWKPEVKLHRIELPQQHVWKEEEVLADQQLFIQERNSSLDQEDPEPPQIKEEQEELCTSQEGEQLVLKQETDTFMLTPTYEERDHSEAELKSDHQLLSHSCHVAESQDQKGGEHEDSGSTRDAEPEQKNQDHKSRSHRNNVNKSTMSEVHHNPHTELPQQHVWKEEEVLADQQLCIQERNSSLDQEDPEPPQIKEEQEELCTSQEGEQLVLKQETDTFMLTPTYEERDHSEAELKSDHQLLSHSCHVAESQDQKGGEHEDSGSTRDAEPEQKNQDHKSRSHRNNVNKSTMSEVHHNPHTELPQQHVWKEEEVLADQQLCIQERNSSLDQEDPEPPQIKEEQEELCTSQEGEQLVLKQETDTFMLTPTYEERDHSEAELKSDHQLLSHSCHVAESQDQKGGEHEDSGSTRDAEPEQKNQDHKSRSHRNNVNNSTMSEVHHNPHTELPQQHVWKEEEVLADQQFCIQERNSSLDQEDPEPPQIKEEQEELCTSQEGEQLVLKQETDTFMLTPTYEERDHSEAELKSDHQLLSHSCHVAESQDQKGGEHEDAGSTRDAEPEQKNQDHKSRSHRNNVNKSTMSEVHNNSHTELPQQHVWKEEEVLADQQLCIQERNSSLDQEDPEPPQIKEEQEELCTSQEGEQLVLKQETDTFMLTPTYEERDHSEAELKSDHQLLSHSCHVAESQDQKGGEHEDSGSTRDAEPEQKNQDHKSRSHRNNVNKSTMSEVHHNPHTELPQQHVWKEEEVLADQQLCIQERNSSLDQEDPEPPQIKEEQEELCTSQEGEQLVLKQETDTFMLTPTYEERDHSEAELKSDHQLLSHSCHVAESQDQKGGEHEDSGSTRDAEPKQNQDHKSRSHRNNVNKSTMSEVHHNPHTELPQQHVWKEEEVLADQQLCIQERNSSLDQEDPEPPQIKEEQEELCTSQEGEQLVLKQETDTFMLTPTYEERDHSEAELKSDHQLLSHSCHVTERQDQKGGEHEDSGSTRDAEPEQKNQDHKSRSHRNNVNNSTMSEVHHNPHTELPQQHVWKEEEVLADQQLCIQERNSSLDQEDPEPPQIKEEQEELCTSQEGEQLVLKQETDTFMLTPTYEERDHSEAERKSDHQLLSHSCHVAESQDQKGGEHEDSGSTRDAEPEQKNQDHKSRSHRNNVNKSTMSEVHNNPHTGENSFKCDTCGKDCKYKSLLQTHLRIHTGEKPYSCKICGKSFSYSGQLIVHIRRAHTGEKPYLCKTCGKRFTDTSGLKAHVTIHTGEKPYSCETCGKDFRASGHLKLHMRYHTGEKPYLCMTCGKCFYEMSKLKIHMTSHSSEKPYTCETCGRSFSHSSGLKIHMRRAHTGEKPYVCETCGKSFIQSCHLKVHMRRAHTGEKPYLCKTCGKRFSDTSELKTHLTVHTGEKPYICETCGTSFRLKSHLKVHMRTHTGEKPYLCKICGKRFSDTSGLKTHMRIHTGEKPYTCETCGTSFSQKVTLKVHMRTHTGEKP